jgi:predicted kinase
MKAIILVGCSCSGKSTYVKEKLADGTYENWTQIERDKIRKDVLLDKLFIDVDSTHENMWKYWNFKWEKLVTEIWEAQFKAVVDAKQNLILSDTHLNKNRRDALVSRLNNYFDEVEVIVLGEKLSLDELWKRDVARQHTVGHDVIAKQYEQFRNQFPLFNINKDTKNLDKCVIVDIDGTLTNGAKDRSPYEWHLVGNDEPNDVLVDAIKGLYNSGYAIIFLSGRDSVCRDETVKWIDNQFEDVIGFTPQKTIEYDLFMRSEGDMRKDSYIKQELYFKHIDGKYRVEAVFDDRPSVIRNVWQEFGFKTFAVGNQYIEF